MPIPDYQTVMLPLLQFLEDRKEHSLQEAVDQVSDTFQLTDEERVRCEGRVRDGTDGDGTDGVSLIA